MSSRRSRQTGNVLVPIMLIGLISTLMMGALINYSVFIEQAAVENQLAETRAYWAIMGHFRYAISRQRHAGFCPNTLGCIGTESIRPVLADQTNLATRYERRLPLYRTAHVSIPVDTLTPDQVTEAILHAAGFSPNQRAVAQS